MKLKKASIKSGTSEDMNVLIGCFIVGDITCRDAVCRTAGHSQTLAFLGSSSGDNSQIYGFSFLMNC